MRHSVLSLYPQRRGTREKTTEFGILTCAVRFNEFRSGKRQPRKRSHASIELVESDQLVESEFVRPDSLEQLERSKLDGRQQRSNHDQEEEESSQEGFDRPKRNYEQQRKLQHSELRQQHPEIDPAGRDKGLPIRKAFSLERKRLATVAVFALLFVPFQRKFD